MSTAKKRQFNKDSMSVQSRNKAYGALNILWKRMRPDLDSEDWDTIRNERLNWIAKFLNLKKLETASDLSDAQLGLVLDEMKRMTGQPVKKPTVAPKAQTPARFGIVGVIKNTEDGAEIVHLTTLEQLYALRLLESHIGWTRTQRENYLKPRFKKSNFESLEVKQATALMMQMLTIAAQKDLKLIVGSGKPITREQIRKYIPTLKKKLGIDR